MSLLEILLIFLTIDVHDIIILISTLIGAGGFFGGIIALLKLRPEAGQIVVSAAEGALVVQTGVIAALQEEVARLNERLNDLEMALDKSNEENEKLRIRIRELERLEHVSHDTA